MVSNVVSVYFGSPPLEYSIKTNCIKTLTVDPEICSIFIFLKKGLGLGSPLNFVHHFSKKIFLMSYSLNSSDFIVSLPLLYEISGNECIVIVCYAVFDVINFEIYLLSFI